jgi:hypothetical protein
MTYTLRSYSRIILLSFTFSTHGHTRVSSERKHKTKNPHKHNPNSTQNRKPFNRFTHILATKPPLFPASHPSFFLHHVRVEALLSTHKESPQLVILKGSNLALTAFGATPRARKLDAG